MNSNDDYLDNLYIGATMSRFKAGLLFKYGAEDELEEAERHMVIEEVYEQNPDL